MRTIAGILSGPVDLEVFNRSRALQTLRVENLIGDNNRDEGGNDRVVILDPHF